jgi:hypothetical protein
LEEEVEAINFKEEIEAIIEDELAYHSQENERL